MKDGFIKVAAGIPKVTVADIDNNIENIKEIIDKADREKINLLILPELSVTGYTCGDLFLSDLLTQKAISALLEISEYTRGKFPLVAVGVPIKYEAKLYSCAVLLNDGEILGIVPKAFVKGSKQFSPAKNLKSDSIFLGEKNIPFGCDLIFCHDKIEEYKIALELGEDIYSPAQPGQNTALAGATIIGNLSASAEIAGIEEYRNLLTSSASQRLLCGYILSSAGVGESTQDSVFSGHSLIYENGTLLNENKPFENNELIISEVDVKALSHLRDAEIFESALPCRKITFKQGIYETELTRKIKPNPFLPSCDRKSDPRAEKILKIQSNALARRLTHTHAQKAVIGISGGLDSTLALLVAVRAMKLLGRPSSDILAITMPCFGTTKRTRSNSEILCNELGVSFKEVDITSSVRRHFSDIGHSENEFDVTFENSQARERTQVLMDIANKENGIVIGTGDISELALGWATYNGDHMSMYGVNAGVPKTLIRHIVRYEAENSAKELKDVLTDILDTPVSPELLPSDSKGEIAQKTEDLVGPYDLHDFFLYHTVRYGSTPSKIFRLAKYALPEFDDKTILHWLKIFLRRFFIQQFKRSCLPDGPKVGTVSLSPRGDWQMPTDASYSLWLNELEELS